MELRGTVSLKMIIAAFRNTRGVRANAREMAFVVFTVDWFCNSRRSIEITDIVGYLIY